MQKDERTYFKFEQVDGREPDVDIHGDPDTLLSAALALICIVVDQNPQKARAAKTAFRVVMRHSFSSFTPEQKKRIFWNKIIEATVGVLALFGLLLLVCLFLGKVGSLF